MTFEPGFEHPVVLAVRPPEFSGSDSSRGPLTLADVGNGPSNGRYNYSQTNTALSSSITLHPGDRASVASTLQGVSSSSSTARLLLMIVPESDGYSHKYTYSEDKQDVPLVRGAAPFGNTYPSNFEQMGTLISVPARCLLTLFSRICRWPQYRSRWRTGYTAGYAMVKGYTTLSTRPANRGQKAGNWPSTLPIRGMDSDRFVEQVGLFLCADGVSSCHDRCFYL